MKEKVEEVLGRIRNALKMDGGDIELVNVENNVVTVRLNGACAGCPFSQMTIRNFVEKELKKAIPEIEKVEAAPIDEEDEEE
jgi:Fe-S cluster biogenesis protein NfuA